MVFESTFISLGTWLLGKIADKGFEKLSSDLYESDNINKKFYKAVEKTSNSLSRKYPEVLGNSILLFFKSEAIFGELIKLLFKNAVVNIEVISNVFDQNTLPSNFIYEFISELKLELSMDRELNTIISDNEIYILICGLQQDVEIIAKNSILTKDQLHSIKNILEQRIGNQFSAEDFLNKYKSNAINNLSQVNFIGLGVDISIKRKRKKLQDVFVQPNFILSDDNYLGKNVDEVFHDNSDTFFAFKDLFTHSTNLVVLGNPGSGKSVLVKSIICNILEGNSEFVNEDIISTLPFRIELRKYLAFKKNNRGNILKYLSSLLEEEYAISNITPTILDNLIKTTNSIFFFDGLDEIFKIEDKIEIRNDIENFHSTYTSAKSLTTSRIIGYDEARLNTEYFCEINILNFDDNQITEYLYKWYEKEEDVKEIRDREIEGFLEKIHEIDDELVSNPLLLSLIVIIYRNTLKLPESKLEIYQSCTKTLVEKWDASKGLNVDLDPLIYKNKEKILADLAYWQYVQLSGEEIEITFDKALFTVIKTIEDKLKIEDRYDSIILAESFMEYAQKRSIYFDNNFTHKTFLEYFTAYWIYSNVEKKNKTDIRNEIISQYIDNPFWHIVLELLLNMIDNDQADCEIMDDLMTEQLNQKDSFPFMLSTINSFKNVSQQCLRNVIYSSIDFLIHNYVPKIDFDIENENLQSKIYELIKELYRDPKIKILIQTKLIEIENKFPELADIFYSFYFEIDMMSHFNFENKNTFSLANEKLFIDTVNKNPYLFIAHIYTFNEANNNDNYMSIIKRFINSFGADAIFQKNDAVFDRYYIGAFVSFYFDNQAKNIKTINDNIMILKQMNISTIQILSHLNNYNNYFSKLPEYLHDILTKFEEELDKEINAILLLLILNSWEGYHNSKDKITLEELTNKYRKKEIINAVSRLKKENRVEEILKLIN